VATFTLTGDLGNLTGAALTSPAGYRASAWVQPVGGVVINGSDVMIGSTPIVLDANDDFSIVIPTGTYTVRVRYYDQASRQIVDWNSRSFAFSANASLATLIA